MEEQAVQLKIVLKYSKPAIWRRLLVKSSISLHELHQSIQIAMGWSNRHLYEFEVDDYRIGDPNEEFAEMHSKVINARNITLGEILPGIKKFSYEYDFGDCWIHEITVEKTLPLEADLQYPWCVAGKLNCPPEDCGGIPGFYDLLDALKNKKHPNHQATKQWLGNEYDPTEFDQIDINLSLSEMPELEEDNMELENILNYEEWDEEDEDEFDLFPELIVRIVNKSNHPLPEYESESSAGMDLRAYIDEKIILKPLERALIKTGIYIELPVDFEAQIRPRSGLALKHGITVLNAPGTIDADYRGEIGVVLVNLSNEAYTINNGDRIAQMVIAHYERAVWEEVKNLGKTDRGEGGFGSTGFQ